MKIDPEKTADAIIRFIRLKVREKDKNGAVIGLSGGLDSATVMALAVRAVGPGRVWALYLPDRSSEPKFLKRSRKLASDSGVYFKIINIEDEVGKETGIYNSLPVKATGFSVLFNRLSVFLFNRLLSPVFLKDIPFVLSLQQKPARKKHGIESLLQSSIEAVEKGFHARHVHRRKILERFAAKNNLLMLGTANRSEFFAGWFVKGGIDDTPVSALLGLYKNQVRQLAEFLSIPGEIIKQPPSPDMLKGISDENILGISYDKIDRAAYVMEKGMDENLALNEGVSLKEFSYIKKLHDLSSWKRRGNYQFPEF